MAHSFTCLVVTGTEATCASPYQGGGLLRIRNATALLKASSYAFPKGTFSKKWGPGFGPGFCSQGHYSVTMKSGTKGRGRGHIWANLRGIQGWRSMEPLGELAWGSTPLPQKIETRKPPLCRMIRQCQHFPED